MNKIATKLLALLLMCVFVMSLSACGITDTPEPTEEGVEIRIPEIVTHEECTELGTPLADVKIRQALALAIDMDTVIQALYVDTGKSAVMDDFRYDPEKAKELLADAGWPSDYVLDVVYYQAEPQIEDLLNVIIHYWDEVGVKAEFRKIEEDVVKQLWSTPDDPDGDSAVAWDLAICVPTDRTELGYFNWFASDHPRNSHTPEIEGLNEAIELGDAEQIQKILAEYVSYIPLLQHNGFVYTSNHLDNANMEAGIGAVLNWTTDREDNTLYTIGVPEENGLCSVMESNAQYRQLVFECLLGADCQNDSTAGRIAENFTFDEKTAVFTIREDLIWHDGQPLTAEDVKFTFELYLQLPDLDPKLDEVLDKLEGADEFVNGDTDNCVGITVEENQVTFRFAETAEDVLGVFAQWPILPQHKLENVKPAKLDENKFWKAPVGSGPYKVMELDLGKTCLLERWEEYWQEGTGNIDLIRMHTSGDGLAALAAGDLLDYGWGVSADDAAYIAQLEYIEVQTLEQNATVCFFINKFPHESYHASAESTEPTE